MANLKDVLKPLVMEVLQELGYNAELPSKVETAYKNAIEETGVSYYTNAEEVIQELGDNNRLGSDLARVLAPHLEGTKVEIDSDVLEKHADTIYRIVLEKMKRDVERNDKEDKNL